MTKRKSIHGSAVTSLTKSEEMDYKTTLVLHPSVNAASVIKSYQSNLIGDDVPIEGMIEGLITASDKVAAGDLTKLEAMLVGQATALQTIFASLARRAQVQEHQKNLEAFLTLALKAQAQSRATIQAVVELKYPRQVLYAKQANISNGPQQVNNASDFDADAKSNSHVENENQIRQNKLLEDSTHERTQMDSGATTAAGRSHKTMETVGKIHRTKKSGG